MRRQLLCMGVALLWVASAAAASSEEAREWIKRMNDALINRSYDGVLTHRWNGGGETLRLIHRMQGGKMVERVISLNGSGYEIFRDGTRFVEYFPAKPPAKGIALVQTRNRSYGYIAALNGLNAESEKFYAISSGGLQRLLGWPTPTQFVSVEPRDAMRYGYRLWLDPQSAMPIRTQLVTKSGEVMDEISFSSLRLVDSIPDGMLKPSVNPNDFNWKKRLDVQAEAVKQSFAPRTELFPAGFRVLNTSALGMAAGREGPQTGFIVSDGISWVSVVVTVAGAAEGYAEGFGPPMGASSTYVQRRDNHYISAMGEVPPPVVKAIAEAFRPE